MLEFAIIVTDENMEMIAAQLNDYTVDDIKEEVNPLKKFGEVVIGVDVIEGFSSVAYIVTRDLFEARNDKKVELNSTEFVLYYSF